MSTFRHLLILIVISSLILASCSNNTVTDIDGNHYRTVTIGTQVWMAENLNVTHYRNGDSIPNIDINENWGELKSGAYGNYDNDTIMAETYGRLYNWYAVNDSRGIAPEGWHIPSAKEWQELADFLGGDSLAGGNMKEKGTTHWLEPNTGSANESGFSSLPAGDRSGMGNFYDINDLTYYWSTTEDSSGHIAVRGLSFENAKLGIFHADKQDGLSIRCIKD